MENLEKQIVRIIENNSPELATEEILRLFSIVGRSELLLYFAKFIVSDTANLNYAPDEWVKMFEGKQ